MGERAGPCAILFLPSDLWPRLAPPSWITAHGALHDPMTSDRHKVVVNASQREVMTPATTAISKKDRNLNRNSAPHLVMCPSIPHLSLVHEFNLASFSNKYFTGGKFSKQSHEWVWVAGERSRMGNMFGRWISPCGSIRDAWNTIVRYNLHPLPAASSVTHILCYYTEGA